MNHARMAVALVFLLLPSFGCASKGDSTGDKSVSTAASATTSLYDEGPRAADLAVDDHLAESGEKLFKDKGCSACHAFGRKVSGPDLMGVSKRRTAHWMEQQILHPDKMVKEDPISRELFGQFALQMPNQGLTAEEARAVIEYLKHQDRESGSESGGEEK